MFQGLAAALSLALAGPGHALHKDPGAGPGLEFVPAADLIPQACKVSFWSERLGEAAHCTGTLISPRHVLTAGHCGKSELVRSHTERTMVSCRTATAAHEAVAETRFDMSETAGRSFASRTGTHVPDLAVLKLDRDIPVGPMELMRPEEMRFAWDMERECYAFGYGIRDDDGGRQDPDAAGLGGLRVRVTQLGVLETLYIGDVLDHGDSGGTLACRSSSGELRLAGVLTSFQQGSREGQALLLKNHFQWIEDMKAR